MKKLIATTVIAAAAIIGLAGCSPAEVESPRATSEAHAAQLQYEGKKAQWEKEQEHRRAYYEARAEYFRNGGK